MEASKGSTSVDVAKQFSKMVKSGSHPLAVYQSSERSIFSALGVFYLCFCRSSGYEEVNVGFACISLTILALFHISLLAIFL